MADERLAMSELFDDIKHSGGSVMNCSTTLLLWNMLVLCLHMTVCRHSYVTMNDFSPLVHLANTQTHTPDGFESFSIETKIKCVN